MEEEEEEEEGRGEGCEWGEKKSAESREGGAFGEGEGVRVSWLISGIDSVDEEVELEDNWRGRDMTRVYISRRASKSVGKKMSKNPGWTR